MPEWAFAFVDYCIHLLLLLQAELSGPLHAKINVDIAAGCMRVRTDFFVGLARQCLKLALSYRAIHHVKFHGQTESAQGARAYGDAAGH
jgi:hypothetical protein